MHPSPQASIVIVAWGKRAVTEACLHSLDASLGSALGDTWQLVLVDNASPDDTLELFAAWADRATIVALDANRNFSGGCNAGARAARGDVLVFLNNDTIVAPGALERLVQTLDDPETAAAGPRLLYPDGTVQHAGVWMVRERTDRVVPYHLFHHEEGDLAPACVVTDIDCVTAACLAVRADRFAALDGFDETYVNGWEDVDFCLRLRMAGGRIVYRGDVSIVHDEGATRGTARGIDVNAEIFYARWQTMLDDDLAAFNEIWGAGYARPCPPVGAEPADVVVEGPVRALGAAGAQARAVVTGLEAIGIAVAAAEPVDIVIGPLLPRAELEPALRARGRRPRPDAVRLDAAAMPAPILPLPLAPGGNGVLLLLPSQDLALSAALLDHAAALGMAVTVAPTARTRVVEELIATRLPAAPIAPPLTSEHMLAAYAGSFDVVIAADPADRSDRQALICAGAGASVLVREGGPAAALLGDLAAPVGAAPAALSARAERHRRIAERCAPAVVLAGAADARAAA
jgi:GT2 family glycosyltransferase